MSSAAGGGTAGGGDGGNSGDGSDGRTGKGVKLTRRDLLDLFEATLEDTDREAEQAPEPETRPDLYAATTAVRAFEARPTTLNGPSSARQLHWRIRHVRHLESALAWTTLQLVRVSVMLALA